MQGFLRNLQVRLATTGELMVNVVFGYEDEEKSEPDLMDHLLETFSRNYYAAVHHQYQSKRQHVRP